MSVLELPEPASWRSGQRRFTFATLGFLVALLPFAFWAAASLARGQALTSLILLGLLVFPVGCLAVRSLTIAGRTAVRSDYDSTGTTLLPDRWFVVAFVVGLVTLIPSGVLFVVFAPRGELAIPLSRGWQILSPIMMAFIVVVGALGLLAVWKRRGIGYLRVSSSGIEDANVVTSKFFDWQDIVGVNDCSETKRTRKAIVLRLKSGEEVAIEGADLYVPRGVALYWMVRHYWLHPDDRVELSDGRALDRLRDERFALD